MHSTWGMRVIRVVGMRVCSEGSDVFGPDTSPNIWSLHNNLGELHLHLPVLRLRQRRERLHAAASTRRSARPTSLHMLASAAAAGRCSSAFRLGLTAGVRCTSSTHVIAATIQAACQGALIH